MYKIVKKTVLSDNTEINKFYVKRKKFIIWYYPFFNGNNFDFFGPYIALNIIGTLILLGVYNLASDTAFIINASVFIVLNLISWYSILFTTPTKHYNTVTDAERIIKKTIFIDSYIPKKEDVLFFNDNSIDRKNRIEKLNT